MKPGLFELCVELSQELFEEGSYEAAYHALMAALHIADHRDDERQIRQVSEIAASQEEQIDQLVPPHPLSKVMANAHGDTPVYRSLQVHVESVLHRLESTRAVARAGLHEAS